jgi:hypothetical protein
MNFTNFTNQKHTLKTGIRNQIRAFLFSQFPLSAFVVKQAAALGRFADLFAKGSGELHRPPSGRRWLWFCPKAWACGLTLSGLKSENRN